MTDPLPWLPPELEARLRALGLTDLCDLAGDLSEQRLRQLAGEPVTRARTRRLYRLHDGKQPALFIKIQVAKPFGLPIRKWPSFLAKGPALQREAKAIALLDSQGVRTQRVLAFRAAGCLCGTTRVVLIFGEVPDYVDLDTAIAGGLGPAESLASMAAVEAVVAALHARGLGLDGAKYRDFLIPSVGASCAADVVVIDPVGLGTGWRNQRRDLRRLAEQRAAYLTSVADRRRNQVACSSMAGSDFGP